MKNQIQEEHLCFNCGDKFSGRSDRKYCSIKCKNDCNNKIRKEEIEVFKTLDKQLHKNRNVLKKFFMQSKGEVFLDQKPLSLEGFDSRYFTCTVRDQQSGVKMYAVYDYGFIIDPELRIKIYYYEGGFHGL